MSFSSHTKGELCRHMPNRRCCVQAEVYGILLYCNQYDARGIRIITESSEFASCLPQLFWKAFKVEFDQKPSDNSGKFIFSITQGDKLAHIHNVFGYDPVQHLAHHINFGILEEDHCRSAFFKGAFLSGGSVTDPEKGYHLEVATSHFYVSREMNTLLLEAGFSPKEITRKGNYLIYFKHSEAIEEFLTAIGAPLATMDLINTKAEKDLRGSVNRRVNCDAANLDKAIEASQEHLEAIRILEERGMLHDLPEKLKEAVDLRAAYPELTLAQLSQLCNPPITKSSLNYRLRKLITLSKS